MAAALANTVAADPLNHVLGGYNRFRRYTPRMLRTLDIEASPVAKPLLEAVDVLRSDATARPTGDGGVVPPARRVPRRRRLVGAVAPLRRYQKGAAVGARRR